MAGVWGLLSADLRSFEEATAGEVDALQAYWLAFRRSDVRSELLFDPKFTFYRNADIDFSLRWRAAGHRLVAAPLTLERHTTGNGKRSGTTSASARAATTSPGCCGAGGIGRTC